MHEGADADSCDDCFSGQYDPLNDGPDFDLDGLCDAGDPDDDNDGANDEDDCAPMTTGVIVPVGDLGPTLKLGPSKIHRRSFHGTQRRLF